VDSIKEERDKVQWLEDRDEWKREGELGAPEPRPGWQRNEGLARRALRRSCRLRRALGRASPSYNGKVRRALRRSRRLRRALGRASFQALSSNGKVPEMASPGNSQIEHYSGATTRTLPSAAGEVLLPGRSAAAGLPARSSSRPRCRCGAMVNSLAAKVCLVTTDKTRARPGRGWR
jgi:hypothetical protein